MRITRLTPVHQAWLPKDDATVVVEFPATKAKQGPYRVSLDKEAIPYCPRAEAVAPGNILSTKLKGAEGN